MDQKEKSTFSWFSSSWFSRCKIQLHVLVSSTALALLTIVLGICISTAANAVYFAILGVIDLVALESVMHTTQILEAGFKRSTSAVAGAANAAKIFPNPFFYNETTEPEKSKFVLDSWRSLLYRYGSNLHEESGINVRFSQNSASTFTSSLSSGFVKQQICSTPYKKFSDAPANLVLDPLTCKIQAYNRSNLQLLPSSNPVVQSYIALLTRTLWLGPVWNVSENTILSSKSTTKPISGFWFPQISFLQLPPVNDGAKDREFFMYQYLHMSVDPSTGAPIANALGIFVTSHFYTILQAALPHQKSQEEGFQAFLVDANGHVLSASHVTRPFATIYLNTTGGKVWKGCNVHGGYVMGCFYNTSDYAPYRLLHVALTSPIHKNWTQYKNSPEVFSNLISTSSSTTESDDDLEDLEEQFSVFKKELNLDAPGLTITVFLMFPLKKYLAPITHARRVTIAFIVTVSLVGAIIIYFVIRRSTSSIHELVEKMKDPFQAKLSSKRHRALLKQAKEQNAKQRVKAKHQRQQQQRESVLEEEEPKKQEQGKDSKKEEEKEEEEEEEETSWWQRLMEWQPAEIVVLEEEFLAFREAIEHLRGFMKYDFAGAADANFRKNHSNEVSSSSSPTKPTSSPTKANNKEDIAPNVIGRVKRDDDVVAPLNQTENSNGSSGLNAQQQAADEKQNNENPKGILKYSSSSSSKPAELSGELKEKKEKKKKGISFRSDVPIPFGPAKPIMTNRKDNEREKILAALQENSVGGINPASYFSPSSFFKAALYESSMCFVAAIQVPIFTQPDNFFYLDHGDEAKQIFIDLSKFIVEKLTLIALSNGATLLDFCGDFFLIAIQTRKRVRKTKVPSRFTLDLMRVANEIQEEINSNIVKKYSTETNRQTRSLVKLENFLLWNDTSSPLFCTNIENKQEQSSTTTTAAATSTTTTPTQQQFQTSTTTTPTQQSCNHDETSPKKKTIKPIFLDSEICRSISIHDAVNALKRTKPEYRATTEKDIAAISVAMHRECVLYAGLSFGWARLFQWPSLNNNKKSDNSNNTLISRTSSTLETTNIKQQQPSTFSRSVTIFGEAISEAFILANTMKKAELLQESNPYHAIGFAPRCIDMFDMVVARHFVGGVARILSIPRFKKQKQREASEEEIARDEQERELREQRQQQQQQREVEQLQQQFKQLDFGRERAKRQEKQQRELEQQKQRQQERHERERAQRQQQKQQQKSK